MLLLCIGNAVKFAGKSYLAPLPITCISLNLWHVYYFWTYCFVVWRHEMERALITVTQVFSLYLSWNHKNLIIWLSFEWIFFFMSSAVFLTGFRKVPVLGMDQIRMTIRIKQIQSGLDDEQFPESLTCHSILELPLYSTKEIMRERLTEALESNRGFRTWIY